MRPGIKSARPARSFSGVTVFAPLRRFGSYTIPDFAEARLRSPGLRALASAIVLVIGGFYLVPQLKGAGLALNVVTGAPYWVGVAVVGGIVALNVATGGMRGITYVQAFQFWVKVFAISVPACALLMHFGGLPRKGVLFGHQLPRDATARCAVEAREVTPDRDLAIRLDHERKHVVVCARQAVEKVAVECPVAVQPCKVPDRRAVDTREIAADHKLAVRLQDRVEGLLIVAGEVRQDGAGAAEARIDGPGGGEAAEGEMRDGVAAGAAAGKDNLAVGLHREIEDFCGPQLRGREAQIERACGGDLADESVRMAIVVICARVVDVNLATRVIEAAASRNGTWS